MVEITIKHLLSIFFGTAMKCFFISTYLENNRWKPIAESEARVKVILANTANSKKQLQILAVWLTFYFL